MVLNAYTARQIRDAEKPHLDAGEPLMDVAARGLAEAAVRLLRERAGGVGGADVVLLVGSGNNGGDALHAGAALSSRGARVTAVLTAPRHHSEGMAALRGAGGAVLDLAEDGEAACLEAAAAADLLVDGILGTGGSGGLREPAAGLVRGLLAGRDDARRTPAVIACDVPSGLDATTGRLSGPVLPADLTVTFAAPTTGLVAPASASAVGRIETVPIGIEDDLPEPSALVLEDADLPGVWPAPGEGDHKYTRGVVGTVAGSDAFPGAGLMCVRAAINAGAGMVRYTGGAALAGLMALECPEAVRSEHVGADRVQAWAVGSGATGGAAEREIRAALDSGLPVVADAAAIQILAGAAGEGERARASVVMTPHAGELASALEWAVRLSPAAGNGCAPPPWRPAWPRRTCRRTASPTAPGSRRRRCRGPARPARCSAARCCSRAGPPWWRAPASCSRTPGAARGWPRPARGHAHGHAGRGRGLSSGAGRARRRAGRRRRVGPGRGRGAAAAARDQHRGARAPPAHARRLPHPGAARAAARTLSRGSLRGH
ncbi:bifunctional ADP-dependent (S)-NAD(P)H-hydrate dehydratase/NAD(P)H-hydrate epimerase [Rothia sp. AR01]|uniref:NAD(P)H-hydrate epimerase n=1 Tax=Rothia santali TaxID=2949643 RepID=A0A9X2HAZ9_9MICC|nr:NAD(P)H-hydrate epimerase [Rothia santali]MCP3424890.1 bifunctional ADP-dependent (S)-NAD(P)H-hydrate dehydratase/NAD(P)H-hydrate epimerase [Rothia santali]